MNKFEFEFITSVVRVGNKGHVGQSYEICLHFTLHKDFLD